ncbi:bifunctional demethylmenaquinone methyltransferase/2-methoxy-6-polyprenyl-1,4-benzoquinol methylase UbiE [Cytophaga aurantiaca]|uniref:bifunctional demethylmenaquinone methyltransferase/2-methoxy-6-polyprenyl-1,4-benzoquinol methylase UbiE n=1 Tax=Cytophaga aurantiaca TaxID=29530 RepID=UPI00036B50F5|nr:bifunctional demethylmenaquinone methyltransferase/2-methoxy-6-polyprenyl-1,4-benzoquinol methylase UbiE [Cytophaga aurantiaca]
MSVTIKPYQEKESEKREQVELMFNNISPKYDLLNRVLSLGIDKIWRKQALNLLKKDKPAYILDVATGTADLAIEAATRLKPTSIVGIDIAENMLQIGREKIAKKNLDNIIRLQKGDSEKIEFADNTFDAVIVSFGVRNFQHLELGLSEIHRVLKPGGNIMVLEFSKPQKAPFKQVYQFYFKNILPMVGKLVSKDTAAYTYLPDSVNAFPDGKAFCAILEKIGFSVQHYKPFTFGVCTSYVGKK